MNYSEKKTSKFNVKSFVIGAVIGCVVIVLGIGSFYSVDPGYRGVLITLGKVSSHSYPNGVGFKWPFIQRMEVMNVRTIAMSDSSVAYTSDVQTAELSYTLTFNLNQANVPQLYETVGHDYITKKVRPVVVDVLKDVVGRWQAQDLVANRDKARVGIMSELQKRLDKRYFENVTFQITDIEYSDQFETAIENKVIAEQRAQEAVNNTKRIKEEAEQKTISAKAEAEAMEIKASALAKNKGLTEYEAVKKWDGKLPTYMFGESMPFVNIGK